MLLITKLLIKSCLYNWTEISQQRYVNINERKIENLKPWVTFVLSVALSNKKKMYNETQGSK